MITPRAQSLIPRMQEGGLLLTAHIGNWEWMGPWLRKLDVPLIASYSPLKNITANNWMQKFRNRNGYYTIALSDSAQPLRTLIRNRSLFTFLADQDSRSERHENSEFFSQKVHISPLPAIYSDLSAAPAFYAWVVRNPSGELVLDAVELPKESLIQSYQAQLERSILENPSQYYGWTHRRFLSTNLTTYEHFWKSLSVFTNFIHICFFISDFSAFCSSFWPVSAHKLFHLWIDFFILFTFVQWIWTDLRFTWNIFGLSNSHTLFWITCRRMDGSLATRLTSNSSWNMTIVELAKTDAILSNYAARILHSNKHCRSESIQIIV